MILKEAKGIPAWRAPAIVPLIVVTGPRRGRAACFSPCCRCYQNCAGRRRRLRPRARACCRARPRLADLLRPACANAGAPTRTFEVLNAYRPWFLAFGLALPAHRHHVWRSLPATIPTLLFALGGLLRVRRRLGLEVHSRHARRLQSGLRARPHRPCAARRTPSGPAGQCRGCDLVMTKRSERMGTQTAARRPTASCSIATPRCMPRDALAALQLVG